MKLLKQHGDEIADLPKGLVTVLRILEWLSVEVPLSPAYVESVAPVQLKHKFAQVELFSADVMAHFIKIIQVCHAPQSTLLFFLFIFV